MSRDVIIVVSRQFTDLRIVRDLLHDFHMPYVHPEAPDHCLIIGTMEDLDHHFGPLVKLGSGPGEGPTELRIAWHYIVAIMSGRDVKRIGFVEGEELPQSIKIA